MFENVVIDTRGAGEYVPKADIQIRRVKEIVRGIKAVLQWKLLSLLLKDLVAFSVSRLMALNQNVCARFSFTGIKSDFRKELSLAFGNYCKVYNGTDNTTKSRSIPCIALYACCNLPGSWAFYSLLTKTWIRRTQWKKMVTSEDFIEKINALNPEEVAIEPMGEIVEPDGPNQPQQNLGVVVEARNESELGEPNDGPRDEPFENLAETATGDDDMLELIDHDEEESDNEAEDESDYEEEEDKNNIKDHDGMANDEERSDEEAEEPSTTTLQRSERIRDGVRKPGRYAMVAKKLRDTTTESDAQKHGLEKAKVDQIKLVFEELKARERTTCIYIQ
jgi:hypothetical protein